MKLVFIITGLPMGGAQMMLLKLLERLDSRFEPHVISLTTLGDMGPRFESLGVPVDALSMKPGVPNPLAFIRLIKKLKSLKPDIVHTWMYHADLIGGLAARLAGVPSVVWAIRNGNLDADKNKRSTLAIVRACALLSASVPAKILSCSERARRTHILHGYAERKIAVVPNGFDLMPFRPDARARCSVRSELGIDRSAPIVGWIGRFHPQKNVAGFFDAAARLHCRLPNVHFVLAGEGLKMSNPEIARAVEVAGLGPVTHLLGIRDDIPRLMAAMDVLASSSSGEAFSNVLGEAMACGVPCAATDVGDSAYIVGNTGRVAPPTDMPALAAALEELLSLPSQERATLGVRARERIAEYFEIMKIVKQYEALYDELLSQEKSLPCVD